MATFLLYESASGYALFEAKDMDWVGDTPQAVAETVKYVLLHAFSSFSFSILHSRPPPKCVR